MQKWETSMTKQYRWNQTTCFADKHRTRNEGNLWCYQNYGPVFPLSLPDRCNWCSLWGEAPCPGESGGCGARACSPPCRPLLPRQPAVLSFLTLHVHVWLCSFCSSVKTNWEVWGETDKPGITQQSQQEEMAPRWPVGAFVQGGERAPRADTTFTAQITGFLLPSVPNEVDLTCNICKIKLLAGPTNLAIPKP